MQELKGAMCTHALLFAELYHSGQAVDEVWWRTLQVALQQAATDPVTGAIDMDLIQTGVSTSERVARGQLAQEIKTLLISKSTYQAAFAPA